MDCYVLHLVGQILKISLPHTKHAEFSRTLSIYCENHMNIQGQSVDKT